MLAAITLNDSARSPSWSRLCTRMRLPKSPWRRRSVPAIELVDVAGDGPREQRGRDRGPRSTSPGTRRPRRPAPSRARRPGSGCPARGGAGGRRAGSGTAWGRGPPCRPPTAALPAWPGTRCRPASRRRWRRWRPFARASSPMWTCTPRRVAAHRAAGGDELDAHPLLQGREQALVHRDLEQQRALAAPGEPGQQWSRRLPRSRARDRRSRRAASTRAGSRERPGWPRRPCPRARARTRDRGWPPRTDARWRSSGARARRRRRPTCRASAASARRAQQVGRAVDLRGHDVRGHQAGEQDAGEPEEQQHQHDGHDRDEEVRHEQLGPDAPEQAAHEVAAHAHAAPRPRRRTG